MKIIVTSDEVRSIALALPEAEEVEHWEKPSFRVRNKIFAVLQPDGVSVVLKTTHDERTAYTTTNPDVFQVPASFKKLAYIVVRIDRIDPHEFSDLLIHAWKLVSPKKLVTAFEQSAKDG